MPTSQTAYANNGRPCNHESTRFSIIALRKLIICLAVRGAPNLCLLSLTSLFQKSRHIFRCPRHVRWRLGGRLLFGYGQVSSVLRSLSNLRHSTSRADVVCAVGGKCWSSHEHHCSDKVSRWLIVVQRYKDKYCCQSYMKECKKRNPWKKEYERTDGPSTATSINESCAQKVWRKNIGGNHQGRKWLTATVHDNGYQIVKTANWETMESGPMQNEKVRLYATPS